MIAAGLGREWRAVRAILLQPVLARRAQGSLTLSWTLLALAGLGSLTLFSAAPHRGLLFAFMTGVPAAMLMLMWWVYLCANLRLQCHGAASCLVPDLAARARVAFLGAATLIVLVMVGVVGFASGTALLVALLTALVLIEVGVLGTQLRFWTVAGLGWVFGKWASAEMKLWVTEFFPSPAGLAVLTALLLFNGRSAQRRQFGLPAPVADLKADAGAQTPASTPAPLRDAPASRSRLLRILLDPPRRQPRFLDALGPSRFGRHALTCLILLGVCMILRVHHDVFKTGAAAPDLAFARGMFAGVVLMWELGVVLGEARRYRDKRAEQALLALTPAAPTAPAMNRTLADYLLGEFGRMWTTFTLTLACGLVILAAPAGEMARLAVAASCALPLPGILFGDYSARGMSDNRAISLLAAYTVLLFVLIGAAVADLPLPWLAMAVTVIAAAALFARWRWQRMLASPPALPAGRYGKSAGPASPA